MKKSFFTLIIFPTSLTMVPTLLLAFSLEESNFKDVVNYIRLDIIALLLPILIGLAFIVFFWGLSKFILNTGNKDAIEKGKDYMMWGILALFILLSWKAIIGLISSELEIGDGKNYPLLPRGTETSTGVGPGSSGFNR